MTLDQLPPTKSARIVEIDGVDAIAMRLMEMGLTEGETVSYVAAAPLGDPVEYAIRGYRLSLRKTEAARVRIEPVGP